MLFLFLFFFFWLILFYFQLLLHKFLILLQNLWFPQEYQRKKQKQKLNNNPWKLK